MPNPMRSVAATLASLTIVGLLAACGSSNKSDTSAATSASSSSTQASSGSSCVTQAKAATAKYTADQPLKIPTDKLDLTKVKGKTLYFVSVINNEFSLDLLKGYRDAVQRMGAKAKVFDAKGAAPNFPKGMQQALNANADGIVLYGITPALVSKELKAAAAKGIPVVDVYNGQPNDPLTDGIKQHVSADYSRSADALGNWMLADSNCTAQAALFQTPVIGLYKPLAANEPKLFSSQCGSKCSYNIQNADLATFATKLGPQVSNYVRRKPKTAYVQVAFDSMITFVGPALSSSGSKVKLIGHDGTANVLDQIRKDSGPTKVTMAFPPTPWIGWDIADAIARQVAKQPGVDTTIPTRLVDKTNIGSDNAAVFPAYVGFEDKWQKSWTAG